MLLNNVNNKNNNDSSPRRRGFSPNSNSWLQWKVNPVTEQHLSKFSRTLASRPILSVTASRFWPGAKKKSQGVGCISAHLARSGCRGFAPAALAREASPRRDANTTEGQKQKTKDTNEHLTATANEQKLFWKPKARSRRRKTRMNT